MTNTVWVSKGNKENVGGVIEETRDHADISTATFTIGFSTSIDVPPTTYSTPTVNEEGEDTSFRRVAILLDSDLVSSLSLVLGTTYYIWIRVSDSQEIEPVRVPDPVIPM